MKRRQTVVIANTSVFTALALILTFVNTEVPFPLLPYLKFDLAEIPIMILLLLMGPVPSLTAEMIGWIALSIARGWVLGPTMKFLAVVPMILGYWVGIVGLRSFFKGKRTGIVFAFGSTLGAIFRILAASVMNIVVLLWVAPEFLRFAGSMLRTLGYVTTSNQEVLMWTLLLTGVFNGIHVLISTIPALAVIRGAAFKIPWVAQNAWIFERSR